MNSLKAEYPVEALAQALEVSSSGDYAHQHKPQGCGRSKANGWFKRSNRSFQRAAGLTAARAFRRLAHRLTDARRRLKQN